MLQRHGHWVSATIVLKHAAFSTAQCKSNNNNNRFLFFFSFLLLWSFVFLIRIWYGFGSVAGECSVVVIRLSIIIVFVWLSFYHSGVISIWTNERTKSGLIDTWWFRMKGTKRKHNRTSHITAQLCLSIRNTNTMAWYIKVSCTFDIYKNKHRTVLFDKAK